jgi:hypothetical protein
LQSCELGQVRFKKLVNKSRFVLVFIIDKGYLCCIKELAALVGLGNSSSKLKYRDKLCFSMAGHNPSGYFLVSGLQRG